MKTYIRVFLLILLSSAVFAACAPRVVTKGDDPVVTPPPFSSIAVGVDTTAASAAEAVQLLREALGKELAARGKTVSSTAKMKLQVTIVRLKDVSNKSRAIWGNFAGVAHVEATVLFTNGGSSMSFSVYVEGGPINTYGTGTTPHVVRRAAAQIADRIAGPAPRPEQPTDQNADG